MGNPNGHHPGQPPRVAQLAGDAVQVNRGPPKQRCKPDRLALHLVHQRIRRKLGFQPAHRDGLGNVDDGIDAQDIGFAISVDTAARFIERYRLGVGEPFLGVQMVDNSPAAAERFDLGAETGALVIDVVSAIPAADAGLAQWDVIVRIGNTDIETSGDAGAAIVDTLPGDVVELEVVRGQKRLVIEATMGERPRGT
jgi:S1-C subfamily serine protease